MNHRGQVEFLPRLCLSCRLPRVTVSILSTDWGDDRDLSAILPCADPGCDESTEGETLDVFFESKGSRMIRAFKRLTAPDGWVWALREVRGA